MKVILEKVLSSGRYIVRVSLTDYNADEIERIKKFGVPLISIAPKRAFVNGRFTDVVPITALDTRFEFEDEQDAVDFLESLKAKIKIVIDELKSKTDEFSGKDEIVL